MCNSDVEHLLHLFFDCTFAKQCWDKVGLSLDMWSVESAPEWLLQQLANSNGERIVKIVTTLWSIWTARNMKIWEQKFINPNVIVEWSVKYVTDWCEAKKRSLKTRISGTTGELTAEARWSPPNVNHFKLNVDASVFPGTQNFSVGMVIRDHKGGFILGKTVRIAGEVSVFEAEVRGILEALLWLQNLELQNIIIEGDSLLAVNAVKKEQEYMFEVGSLLMECQSILKTRSDISVCFAKKQTNKVAHLLARAPCMVNSFTVFLSPPDIVLETLSSDALLF